MTGDFMPKMPKWHEQQEGNSAQELNCQNTTLEQQEGGLLAVRIPQPQHLAALNSVFTQNSVLYQADDHDHHHHRHGQGGYDHRGRNHQGEGHRGHKHANRATEGSMIHDHGYGDTHGTHSNAKPCADRLSAEAASASYHSSQPSATAQSSAKEKKQRPTVRDVVAASFCTACGDCAASCRKKAISMQENANGVLEPVIDPQRCNDCGKCYIHCPAIEARKAQA